MTTEPTIEGNIDDEAVPEISIDAYEKLDYWRDKLEQTPKLKKRDVFELAAGDLFAEAEYERDLRACHAITDAVYALGSYHAGLSDDDIGYIMEGAKAKAERLINGHAAISNEPPPAMSPDEYGAEVGAPEGEQIPSIIKPTPYKYRPAIEIPKRIWLYGKHYLRNCVSVTIAPPGWTKSTRTLTELIAMIVRRPLLGEMPTADRPLRCWYWSGEDEREEVERRIAAICQHHGINPRALEGMLFYDSFQEVPLKIAAQTRNGLVFNEEQIAQFRDAIIRNNFDVVGVDPLISVHGVSELDNNGMDAVVKTFGKIAADAHCSIDLDHHTRKLAPGQTEITVDDARGAGAIIGAARSSRIINRMTAQQAASYFRIGRAKANRAPPEASTWARMVSVAVPNGDNVGTLEAWEYPDAFANVTTADMYAIRDLVSKKDFRADSRADDWVGRSIADRLKLNINDQANTAKIKQIIKAWIKNGVLAIDEREDDHRKKRKYVIPGRLKDGVNLTADNE
jgi:hypothetical protein